MLIGQAYLDTLTPPEQQALSDACDFLIDTTLNDIENVEKPEDINNTIIGIYLPSRFLPKYTPRFLRKFTVCIITVAWKLAQPEHLPLSSLAEELAAWAIVQEAKRRLADEMSEKVKNAFEAFIGSYFEDLDFEYLYDNAYDGIDETERGQTMGILSLKFNDWFKPFSDEPSRTPHPYVIETDSPEI